MKKLSTTIFGIFICIRLCFAQDSDLYLNFNTNAMLLQRVFPINDPKPNVNNDVGNIALGYGLGLHLVNHLGIKNKLASDIEISWKKRDNYFPAGALFFRLDEQLVFTTLNFRTKYERYIISKLYISLGLFLEYILDKNQNFSYTKLVYSPFNFGPSLGFALQNNRWKYDLLFEYGVPKIVNYFKDDIISIPHENKSFIKYHTIQFAIGYKLFQ